MSKTDKTLNKCDELIDKLTELKKSLTATNVSSNRKSVSGLGAGWSQNPSNGDFHHSTHGVISTTPHPEGGYQITHGGGVVGRVNSMTEAGAKIREHVGKLGSLGTNMYNRPSTDLPGPTKMGKPTVNKSSNPVEKAENLMSNQLANVMAGRSMLGTPPPRQPTDQEMFGHLVPNEEEIQKAEASWGNKMNWLEEAVKPIASRFNSEAEEQAYWDSIKVSDRDDGKSGY